jgi:hypothetical protein
LPEEEHPQHLTNEERDICINCKLDRIIRQLTEFETEMLNWYSAFSSEYLVSSGITAEEWKRLPFESEQDRRIGAAIVSLIHETRERITAEKMAEMKNG